MGGLQAGIPTSRVFIAAGGLLASPTQSPFTSLTSAATFSSILLFLLLVFVCLLGPAPPYCYLWCCYSTNIGFCCCYCYCTYNSSGKLLQTLLLLLLPVTAPGSGKCATKKDYCCCYIKLAAAALATTTKELAATVVQAKPQQKRAATLT